MKRVRFRHGNKKGEVLSPVIVTENDTEGAAVITTPRKRLKPADLATMKKYGSTRSRISPINKTSIEYLQAIFISYTTSLVLITSQLLVKYIHVIYGKKKN